MNSLQMAYEAGVKLAMQEAGLIKEAGPTQDLLSAAMKSQLPKLTLLERLGLLGSQAKNVAKTVGGAVGRGASTAAHSPYGQRAAGGAAAGGLAGALTGDEDSDTLLRALMGAGIGGGAGAASVPAGAALSRFLARRAVGTGAPALAEVAGM